MLRRSRSSTGGSEGPWFAWRFWRGNTRAYFLLLLSAIPVPVLWLLDGFDLNRMLGFEAVALAVAAVLIAIQHTNKLEEVADELRGVARSVPTRAIGTFPSYLPEVAELVNRATKSITILCDTPAHGAFSNTVAFTGYWNTLRHLMVDGNVEIRCTFFDAPGRRELHRAQIDQDSDNWDAWKKRNLENCKAFDRLAQDQGKIFGLPLPANALGAVASWADTPDVYVESMMLINEAVLSSFNNDVTVERLKFSHPLREGPSVYFWLRDDDQEAVFVVVPVRGIGVRDLTGFHTREPELIRALGTVYAHREEGR